MNKNLYIPTIFINFVAEFNIDISLMKRVLLSLILVYGCIDLTAQDAVLSYDAHKYRMIQEIDAKNYASAYEEMTKVSDWTFYDDNEQALPSVPNMLEFIEYVYRNEKSSLWYREKALKYAKDVLELISDYYYMRSSESIELQDRKNGVAYERLLALLMENYGDTVSVDYGRVHAKLGDMYTNLYEWQMGKECYDKAVKILEKLPETFEHAGTQNSLGAYYFSTGHYDKAEETYLKAITICERLGADTVSNVPLEYAAVLGNLGNLYMTIGDYSSALPHLLKAKKATQILGISKEYHYITAMVSIGLCYHAMNLYDEAEKEYLNALPIIQKRLGAKHDMYADMSVKLGSLYMQTGEYLLAKKYFGQAMDILKTYNNESYASCLLNMGQLYLIERRWTEAEQMMRQGCDLYKKIKGEKHPVYAQPLGMLGNLYFQQHHYKQAEEYFAQGADVHKNAFVQSVNFMSDKQRTLYWQTMQSDFEGSYPRFIFRSYPALYKTSQFAYNNELFIKGLLLNSANAVRYSIQESGDTALIRKWDELTTRKQQMMSLVQQKNLTDVYLQLMMETEQLEKEITRSSAAYRENMRQWNITWDSVRAELKPRQVAIEFMRAPLNEDSTMYCALLLRDTCSYPIMIPLFEEKEVTSLLHTKTDNSEAINTSYLYGRNGCKIFELVWKNIQPYLHMKDEVFFAPTGLLHRIAIENLPYDATHTVSDIYHIVRLSSTREIVMNRMKRPYKTAALYGDISYDLRDTSVMLANADRYRDIAKGSIAGLSGDAIQRSFAVDLPGTKKEIDSIKPILEHKHIAVTVYSGDEACEESFKALIGKHPTILHVATHGFFWDDAKAKREQYFRQRGMLMNDPQNIFYIDPLDRCALLFAGANIALGGHSKTLPAGVDDGILTAKEISNLDFRNTDIVVLSACETGLGDITGDGVFGLQRAFKMAGAQTILMTLWQVDDDATQRLMTAFYRYLSSGQSKRQAFRNAQQYIRNYTETKDAEIPSTSADKYKHKGKTGSYKAANEVITTQPYSDPYFWAGFILLD